MYYTMTVKINEDDVRNFLETVGGYDEEEIAELNLEDEAVEIINEILMDYFSDYAVYNKNSILLNWNDEDNEESENE